MIFISTKKKKEKKRNKHYIDIQEQHIKQIVDKIAQTLNKQIKECQWMALNRLNIHKTRNTHCVILNWTSDRKQKERRFYFIFCFYIHFYHHHYLYTQEEKKEHKNSAKENRYSLHKFRIEHKRKLDQIHFDCINNMMLNIKRKNIALRSKIEKKSTKQILFSLIFMYNHLVASDY